jgi:hypothetical protein
MSLRESDCAVLPSPGNSASTWEEDRTLRAALVGILLEKERK